MRASATRKAVLSVVLGVMACGGSPELRADPLDPDAFASLGVFDPTTPGEYTIKYDSSTKTPSIVDPNGKTVATGVESNGIAVFDFDSISVTSTNSAPIFILGEAGPTAFLSRGDISIMDSRAHLSTFMFDGAYPNGVPTPFAELNGYRGFDGQGGPGVGGNGNPYHSPVSGDVDTNGGGGGFGGAGGTAPTIGGVPSGAGGLPYGDLSKALQGGSGGGLGFANGAGGGGGAIELGALGTIKLVGAAVEANGGSGAPPLGGNVGDSGAGSGGGIFLHAPTVDLVDLISGGVSAAGGSGFGLLLNPGGGGGRVLIETNNLIGGVGGINVSGGSANGGGRGAGDGVVRVLPLAVPEPGSGLLVGLGLASLMLARRLRKRGG